MSNTSANLDQTLDDEMLSLQQAGVWASEYPPLKKQVGLDLYSFIHSLSTKHQYQLTTGWHTLMPRGI